MSRWRRARGAPPRLFGQPQRQGVTWGAQDFCLTDEAEVMRQGSPCHVTWRITWRCFWKAVESARSCTTSRDVSLPERVRLYQHRMVLAHSTDPGLRSSYSAFVHILSFTLLFNTLGIYLTISCLVYFLVDHFSSTTHSTQPTSASDYTCYCCSP